MQLAGVGSGDGAMSIILVPLFPRPASFAMLGSALLGLGLTARRRRAR